MLLSDRAHKTEALIDYNAIGGQVTAVARPIPVGCRYETQQTAHSLW